MCLFVLCVIASTTCNAKDEYSGKSRIVVSCYDTFYTTEGNLEGKDLSFDACEGVGAAVQG